jgi:CO dehydrogenase nickel-insertion accessory protein CooC1
MRIVAVISPKGGVGKTTVTANLAAELTKSGEHVLALDLDPQNALRFTSPGCGTLILQGIARLQKGQSWREALQSSTFEWITCRMVR